jgi:ubiquinone biosynthesis UbiH/UbiF/VisC/COQ6 family hydroxylase
VNRPVLAIAGGGPVGLALACACPGFDVRLVESGSAAAPRDEFDVRVFALSPGTRDLLLSIGAWQRLDASRVASVRHMEVFGDEGARLGFEPRPGAALAWIVEASRLSRALEQQAESLAHIRIVRGRQAIGFNASASGGSIELEGGERIEASLVVGADGPDSHLRAGLGIAAKERPYAEAAIVANFASGREHGAIARQWFRADGVLAWLPLPGRRISIVWSTPLAVAEELAALDERAFERRVAEAGHEALGALELISPRTRFPLRSIRVANPVAPGAALVGDAAHAVHPLAGQGVNLGFQDVHALARVLAQRSALERPGDLRVLRRYARARREEVDAMQLVTHGLDRLFGARAAQVRALRNLGMTLVDAQPWAKRALARRAMR